MRITDIKEDKIYPNSDFYDSIRTYESGSDIDDNNDSDDNNINHNRECNNNLSIYNTSTYLGLEDIKISPEFLYNLYMITVIINWVYVIYLLSQIKGKYFYLIVN